jgi:hypothetical protein
MRVRFTVEAGREHVYAQREQLISAMLSGFVSEGPTLPPAPLIMGRVFDRGGHGFEHISCFCWRIVGPGEDKEEAERCLERGVCDLRVDLESVSPSRTLVVIDVRSRRILPAAKALLKEFALRYPEARATITAALRANYAPGLADYLTRTPHYVVTFPDLTLTGWCQGQFPVFLAQASTACDLEQPQVTEVSNPLQKRCIWGIGWGEAPDEYPVVMCGYELAGDFHLEVWYQEGEGERFAQAFRTLLERHSFKVMAMAPEEPPAAATAKQERSKAPGVPSREEHLERWKAIWLVIKGEVEGKGEVRAREILQWLGRHKEYAHFTCHEKTLRKIIRAGKAGLLD